MSTACPRCASTDPTIRTATGYCVPCAVTLCGEGDGDRAGLPVPGAPEAAITSLEHHMESCLEDPADCLVCALQLDTCPECGRDGQALYEGDPTYGEQDGHRVFYDETNDGVTCYRIVECCEGYLPPAVRAAALTP